MLLRKFDKVVVFFLNKLRYGWFTKVVNSDIGPGCTLESNVRIIGLQSKAIKIGRNFYCNANTHIFGEVSIGGDVMIGPQSIIWSRNHRFERDAIFKEIGHEYKNITIGSNVWIGANVTILPGVRIPDNCVVGAGAVVTKAFDREWTVIAGNPAKVLKEI